MDDSAPLPIAKLNFIEKYSEKHQRLPKSAKEDWRCSRKIDKVFYQEAFEYVLHFMFILLSGCSTSSSEMLQGLVTEAVR